MNSGDWLLAWDLTKSWDDPTHRAKLLATLNDSPRRPHVAIALIRIAALLSRASKVVNGFTEQLIAVDDTNLELGVLNITDQILTAVDADDSPQNADVEELLETIPDTFAFKDIAAHER